MTPVLTRGPGPGPVGASKADHTSVPAERGGFHDDCHAYAVLEERLLPQLVRSAGPRRQLRIWSAGCGDGADLYAVAIGLRPLLSDRAAWRLALLGSDADPAAVWRARLGLFDEAAFADSPAGFRQRNFRRSGEGRWAVLPQIRRLVDFAVIALDSDRYPSLLNHTGASDLIICRGQLGRLDGASAQRLLVDLARCLREDGWLLLGTGEPLPPLPAGLEPQPCAGATVLRKLGARRPACVAALPPSAARQKALEAYRDGDFATASVQLLRRLESMPADIESIELLIRSEANLGRLDQALAYCQRALGSAPTRPAVHYLRACVLLELGATGEAMQALQRALCLDPGYLIAHFALGSLARRLGRQAEAERHFANARALVHRLPAEQVLVDADGVTAGRMAALIASQHDDLPRR
jgi:chemotaxis protein methyltransferase CheR